LANEVINKESIVEPEGGGDSEKTNISASGKVDTSASISETLSGIGESSVVVKGEKVMITGDDILVEYCDRLMTALKTLYESQIKVSWKI
jgi:hypothetical protein